MPDDEQTARSETARHFLDCGYRILKMMQRGVNHHDLEGTVGERQILHIRRVVEPLQVETLALCILSAEP